MLGIKEITKSVDADEETASCVFQYETLVKTVIKTLTGISLILCKLQNDNII